MDNFVLVSITMLPLFDGVLGVVGSWWKVHVVVVSRYFSVMSWEIRFSLFLGLLFSLELNLTSVSVSEVILM